MAENTLGMMQSVAEAALAAAKKAGAGQAAAGVSRSRFVDVAFRDGAIQLSRVIPGRRIAANPESFSILRDSGSALGAARNDI